MLTNLIKKIELYFKYKTLRYLAKKFPASFNWSNLSNFKRDPYLRRNLYQKMLDYFSKENDVLFFRICTSGIKINSLNSIQSNEKPLHLQFSMHSPFDIQRKTNS